MPIVAPMEPKKRIIKNDVNELDFDTMFDQDLTKLNEIYDTALLYALSENKSGKTKAKAEKLMKEMRLVAIRIESYIEDKR